MATIKEVAQLADVSVATVSRVLNNVGAVAEGKRQRVLEAVKELNYTPNLTARNLRRNESRTIMVFLPMLSNPYYYSILSGICDVARELDYSAYICSIEKTPHQEEALINAFQNKNADGVIFLSCNQDDLWLAKYGEGYPIVFCSEYVESLDFPRVSIDNRQAAQDAVRAILAQGHRKIGLISSRNTFISTRLRYQGYCAALAEAGVSFRSDYVAYASTDYSFESGVEAARSLLTLSDPPTALFCISDLLALGAISVANELHCSVPGDLTVWGFDNVDLSRMIHPYLSTVSQPCYELGRDSMNLLHRRINGVQIDSSHLVLPHELIVRESSSVCNSVR